VLLADGDAESAMHYHRTAADLADDLDLPRSIARARDRLAHSLIALGRPDQAAEQWEWTLARHGTLEITEMNDIRHHLRLLAAQPLAVAQDSTSARTSAAPNSRSATSYVCWRWPRA
jgi:hypothetical protein